MPYSDPERQKPWPAISSALRYIAAGQDDHALYTASVERRGRRWWPVLTVQGGPNHSPFSCCFPDLMLPPSWRRGKALRRAVDAACRQALEHGDLALIRVDGRRRAA